MGGCRCTYKSCTSATKTRENLHFFHYPVKHRERCAIWIKNAEKPEFLSLPDDQLRNKVICGLHFEDKYFTNVNKKRLVHDAIPNLDEGCATGVYVKEVEVLPTSVDGTTFTLQTLQPGTSRSVDNKFGFSNGKVIVHKFDDSESEVYTIDPLYIHETFYNPNNNKTIFLNSNSQQSDSNEFPPVFVKQEESHALFEPDPISIERNGQQNNAHLLFTDEEESSGSEESTVKNQEMFSPPPVVNRVKKVNSKNVLKRINMHSQEIARIKRSLAISSVKHSRMHLIRMLRGKIPDTLLGAVSLNLFKRTSDLNREEKLFLDAMFTASPSAYKTFQEIGWFIPKPLSLDIGIPNGDGAVNL